MHFDIKYNQQLFLIIKILKKSQSMLKPNVTDEQTNLIEICFAVQLSLLNAFKRGTN